LKQLPQRSLYEPTRQWLLSQGFDAAVTGANLRMVVPIADLVPMPYKVPDVVGCRENDVAIIEVETSKKRFFDALGRCLLWKSTAMFVFLAYPAGTLGGPVPLLERLGVGLLEVDVTSDAVHAVMSLPLGGGVDHFRVVELHPLDYPRQQELVRHIRAACL
jgi:hypothetical protein